jgi:hypothetical protein
MLFLILEKYLVDDLNTQNILEDGGGWDKILL